MTRWPRNSARNFRPCARISWPKSDRGPTRNAGFRQRCGSTWTTAPGWAGRSPPLEKKVHVYRPNKEPESLSGDPVLPALRLDLRRLWP